jgi:hypothetical protein
MLTQKLAHAKPRLYWLKIVLIVFNSGAKNPVT